jgi:hypothetical protein
MCAKPSQHDCILSSPYIRGDFQNEEALTLVLRSKDTSYISDQTSSS